MALNRLIPTHAHPSFCNIQNLIIPIIFTRPIGTQQKSNRLVLIPYTACMEEGNGLATRNKYQIEKYIFYWQEITPNEITQNFTTFNSIGSWIERPRNRERHLQFPTFLYCCLLSSKKTKKRTPSSHTFVFFFFF